MKLTGTVQINYGLTGKLSVNLDGNSHQIGSQPKFRLSALNAGECIFNIEGEVGLGGDIHASATISANLPVLVDIEETVAGYLGKLYEKVTGQKVE